MFEDPHFSYFYLSESLNENTSSLYPGYSIIIATYTNGVEKYFIRQSEAQNTSQWIIDKIITNKRWFEEVLAEIERKSKDLELLSSKIDVNKAYEKEQLLELYDLHFRINTDLYKIARIPEALDRGETYFTNYLKKYLYDIGFKQKEIPQVFNYLTTPTKLSIFGVEESELDCIRNEVCKIYPNIRSYHTPNMLLNPTLRRRLITHTNKWELLNYHGYRNPKLLKEIDFLERILSDASSSFGQACQYYSEKFLEKIDDLHKILFNFYTEIGLTKIWRRFYQLHNFYFLDRLLFIIADKLGVSENTLRFCLPYEIRTALLGGQLPTDIDQRIDGCAILYAGGKQTVLVGGDYEQINTFLDRGPKDVTNKNYRKGHCISLGKVLGRARKIDQKINEWRDFKTGDILICHAIDPDFFPLIKKAAGIVTAQGGVTSHASIVCRELGIPTISGVTDVLEWINNGDLVEIDSYDETIKIIADEEFHNEEILISNKLRYDIAIVGNKAANLSLAVDKGIKVPKFYVLSYDLLKHYYESNRGELAIQLKDIYRKIDENETTQFVLRSSCTYEDSPERSCAGYYKSFVLNKENPINTVKEFINYNDSKNYYGSLILQQFIQAEYAGVCMLGDIRYKNNKHLVIEYSKGSINYATSGKNEINRIIFDVSTQECISEEIVINEENLTFGYDVIQWFKSIESKFPTPIYLEWGYKDKEFWLYQLRQILNER